MYNPTERKKELRRLKEMFSLIKFRTMKSYQKNEINILHNCRNIRKKNLDRITGSMLNIRVFEANFIQLNFLNKEKLYLLVKKLVFQLKTKSN